MMSTIGAIIGLLLSIFLIIKRIPIAYSLMIGAITGGLSGGLSLVDSVSVMVDGVKDITPAILRILAAGDKNRCCRIHFQYYCSETGRKICIYGSCTVNSVTMRYWCVY